MAHFQKLILQIFILSLCLALSTVDGKPLNKSPGRALDKNNEYLSGFDHNPSEVGDRPFEHYDEEYKDQYSYNSADPATLEREMGNERYKLAKPIQDTNLDHSLPVNHERSSILKKIDDDEDVMPEHRYKMDSIGKQYMEESVESEKKSAPSGSGNNPAQFNELNVHQAPVLPRRLNGVPSEVGQAGTSAKNTKRGVLKNTTGNQTDETFVNGKGKKIEALERGMAEPREEMFQGKMATGIINNKDSISHNDENPNGDRGAEAVDSGIPKTEKMTEHFKMSEPQSGSVAAQPLPDVTSGNTSNQSYKNDSDTELDLNKTESINSSSNIDKSTTVKNGDSNSGVNTSLSSIKPDSHVTPTNSSETNPTQGAGEPQQPDGPNNNTGSLTPEQNGTVSQQATSKAPSPVTTTTAASKAPSSKAPSLVAAAAAAASSKVPSVSQTSKPPLPLNLGGPSYDSSSSSTTAFVKATHGSTTDHKEPSIKSDDSDLTIDQPPEGVQNGGFNSQQPNHVESVEEAYPMVHSTPVNDEDSHFFAYFASLLITAAVGYVVYHNRNKILALVLEGRRGRGYSGSRRGSSAGSIGRRRGRGGGGGGAKYQPLHTSLDQVMTSNGTENGGESTLDRVY